MEPQKPDFVEGVLDDLLGSAEEYARREPTKAVISAAGAGLALNFLPLGDLAGGATALAFRLVRPALLVLGLLKAWELLQTNAKSHLK